MSVYKEMGFAIREIENKSKQIFPDAADFGVPVKSFDDPIFKLIMGVKEQYNLKLNTYTYTTGSTQTLEFDGGWPAVIEAGFEKATIQYITTRNNKEMKGYITFNTYTSEAAKRKAANYDA